MHGKLFLGVVPPQVSLREIADAMMNEKPQNSIISDELLNRLLGGHKFILELIKWSRESGATDR